jgi:two-component system, OmpR family, response regulator PrrA
MMPTRVPRKIPRPRAEFPTTVLIVDDEPPVRWSLSAGLRVAGFDTLTAASAEDARTAASHWPSPDIALLDLRIYAGHAGSLLRDLRRAAPRCQFIVMAGRDQELPREAWEGVVVLRKPCDLSQVVHRINSVLSANCVE